MLKKRWLQWLILLIPFLWAQACHAGNEMVVIANNSVPVRTMSLADARLVFTGTIKSMGGTQIVIVTMKRDHEIHTLFAQEVLRLYPYQIERSIERKRYAGMTQMYIDTDSAEEMLEIVARTPGALGYVNKAMVNKTVKVIEVRHE